jgi:hypothetical protein
MQAVAYCELDQDEKATESCLVALSNPSFSPGVNALLDRIENKKKESNHASVIR